MPKIEDIKKVTGINNSDKIIDLLELSDKYKNKISKNVMGVYSIEGDLNEIAQYLKKAEVEYEIKQAEQKAENSRIQAANSRMQKEISAKAAGVLITSGYSFEGYNITRYSGYISGDDCITMPRDNFFGTNKVADNLCGSLVKIRRQALKELKEAAVALDCNAVIGVDFDYIIMDPQHNAVLNLQVTVYEPYVICVTANGTAVLIEKKSGYSGASNNSNVSVGESNTMTEIRETVYEEENNIDNSPKAIIVDDVLVCQGCNFVMDNPDPEMKFCPQCGLEIVRQ